MIANENQYRVTTQQIDEFSRSMKAVFNSPYASADLVGGLVQTGFASQLADLKQERADYRRNHRVTIQFKWFDLWVGVFVDTKDKTAYICPLPTVVIRVFLAA